MRRNALIGLISVIGISLLAALVLWGVTGTHESNTVPAVMTFHECTERYSVMESDPRRCRTPSGKVFVEQTEPDRQSAPVRITAPKRGARVNSPLVIRGRMPGTWFFEARATAAVRRTDGALLGTATLQAQENWMTEAPVPFRGTSTFSVADPTEAFVVIERANPSGSPEHAQRVRIPVTVVPGDNNERDR